MRSLQTLSSPPDSALPGPHASRHEENDGAAMALLHWRRHLLVIDSVCLSWFSCPQFLELLHQSHELALRAQGAQQLLVALHAGGTQDGALQAVALRIPAAGGFGCELKSCSL